MKQAWHFVGDKLRDGRDIPDDGEWLIHEGEVRICRTGLHASENIIDALRYAPGFTVCHVECDDVREEENDKFVCTKRRILWRLDAKGIISAWSRRVASDVLHLWDAPDVVKRFLETGENARAAANAARAAANAARAADAAAYAAAYAAYAAADAAAYATANAANATADAAYATAYATAYAARAADAAAYAANAAYAAAQKKYETWLLEAIEAGR